MRRRPFSTQHSLISLKFIRPALLLRTWARLFKETRGSVKHVRVSFCPTKRSIFFGIEKCSPKPHYPLSPPPFLIAFNSESPPLCHVAGRQDSSSHAQDLCCAQATLLKSCSSSVVSHKFFSASVIGDVTIGENSSVWYNAVVSGATQSSSRAHSVFSIS